MKGALRSRSPNWSCSLIRIVLQDALSEVMKEYPPTKPKVFVDDITSFLELPGIAETILSAMRVEVEEKGLKLSFSEGGRRKGRARSLRHAAIWKKSFRNADLQSVLN